MSNKSINKGFSLMELISAIAILSIVAIAAFTLLMFSINSNNLILAGASASQDAELLNKRLELLFDGASFSETETFQKDNGVLSIKIQDDELKFVEADSSLSCGTERWHYDISKLEIERVPNTSLIKISYSIGDHQFTKLFRVNFLPEDNEQPQNTP